MKKLNKKIENNISNANSSWDVFKRIYAKIKIGDIIGFTIKRKHFKIVRDK